MYFPENMTFQYFFFDTYPGMFLQVLPLALAAGILWLLAERNRKPSLPLGKRLFRALFVCYVTGLFCLTLFLDVVQNLYYGLLYHHSGGNAVSWFTGAWDWIPDFFFHFSGEDLWNILLFCPFGVLYPLFQEKLSWKRTLAGGFFLCLAIEFLQPVFGRSFDINDVVLNMIGLCLSAGAFFGVRGLARGR